MTLDADEFIRRFLLHDACRATPFGSQTASEALHSHINVSATTRSRPSLNGLESAFHQAQ